MYLLALTVIECLFIRFTRTWNCIHFVFALLSVIIYHV